MSTPPWSLKIDMCFCICVNVFCFVPNLLPIPYRLPKREISEFSIRLDITLMHVTQLSEHALAHLRFLVVWNNVFYRQSQWDELRIWWWVIRKLRVPIYGTYKVIYIFPKTIQVGTWIVSAFGLTQQHFTEWLLIMLWYRDPCIINSNLQFW